jgi:hypothetical protein
MTPSVTRIPLRRPQKGSEDIVSPYRIGYEGINVEEMNLRMAPMLNNSRTGGMMKNGCNGMIKMLFKFSLTLDPCMIRLLNSRAIGRLWSSLLDCYTAKLSLPASLARAFQSHRARNSKSIGITCGYITWRIPCVSQMASFHPATVLAGDWKRQCLWSGTSSVLKEAFLSVNLPLDIGRTTCEAIRSIQTW